MAYINRAQEKIIKNYVSESKCLLLNGARQVGKSTLLNHLFKKINSVSFDDEQIRLDATTDPKLFFKNNPCPLFIDEVQKVPQIFEQIKLVVDNNDSPGQFILSGSQNLLLFKNISESLAGRVSINELNGLSLREIFEINFNKHFIPNKNYISSREKVIKRYENLWDIIHRGSYPELYSKKRNWQNFYASYVNTYIERDINELVASDSITFMQFLIAVAARTGQIIDYNNIASEVGVSAPTVKQWISILERTGIVYLLQPFTSSALKRATRRPKIYFRDTGLVCYLTKWQDAQAVSVSAVAGNLFETFVVSEILKSFSNSGFDYRFSVFFYRGRDKYKTVDNEIDLIIEEDGTIYPIEIKLTCNPKASMAKTNELLDAIPNKQRGMGAIICLIDQKKYLRENLIALPIEYI